MAHDRVDPAKRAFLAWIDAGQELRPEASRWPVETLGLREAAEAEWRGYLVGELQDCPDILPDAYCDRIRMPRGCTYGEAARMMSRGSPGRDKKSVM